MAANLPKYVAVGIVLTDLSKFKGDLGKASAAVDQTVKKINTQSNLSKSLQFDPKKTLGNIKQLTSGFSNFFRTFDARNNPLTGFGQQLEGFSRSIRYIGQDIGRLGMTLTAAFTLPILVAGVAAAKMGADFDRAMVKVGTLVNQSEAQIASWRQEILTSMSGLGQLPTELADGLFFAASGFGQLAGQAPVMEILESAAKAATIGLGEMGDIAKISTAIINAYGQENVGAAESVYLLVQAVQEGSFEASELATSLGRALGLFSSYEVPIRDLLAQIATLTRIGETPTRAITSLNNALNNIVKPSGKARDIMEAVNIEFSDFRDRIKEPGGLIDVLEELATTLPPDYFAQLFGIRGAKAAQAFTTSMRQALAEVNQAFGEELTEEEYAEKLNELFIRTTNTISGQAQIMKGQIGALGVVISDAFKPQVLEGLRELNRLIAQLTKTAAENPLAIRWFVGIAAAIAAIGPTLIIFSRLTLALGVVTGLAGRLFITLGSLLGIVINLARSFIVLGVQAVALTVKGLAGIVLFSIKAGFAMAGLITKTFAYVAAVAAKVVAIQASITAQVAETGVSFAAAAAKLVLAAATGAVTLSMSGFLAVLGGVVTTLITLATLAVAAGTAILLIAAAASRVGETIKSAFSTIRGHFEGMNEYADSFGEALMIEYSNGIIAGIAHVVRALTYVARVITGWLAPGSPPKILPEIDKWGTETMNEWIKGWGKADFTLFDDIFSTVKGYFEKILDVADDDRDGIVAGLLLGSREAVASAITQTKQMGRVTQNVLKNVYDALTVTTPALEGYLSSQLAVVAATTQLERAQSALNAITERYAKILLPIENRLAAINHEQEEYQRLLETERLEELLKDPRLTERAEQQIQLRLEEIALESDKSGLERSRDLELARAEEQVALAEQQLEEAQKQVEFWEGVLGLQESMVSLMEDLINAVKDGAEKVAKAAAGAGLEGIGAGGIELPDIEEMVPGGEGEGILGGFSGILGDLDQDLINLGNEITIMRNAWAEAFEAMTGKASVAIATVLLKWNTFKTFWAQNIQPIIDTLAGEGAKTWDAIKEEFGDIFVGVEEAVTNLKNNAWDAFVASLQAAPGWITTFAESLRNDLIPALGDMQDKMAEGFAAQEVQEFPDFWQGILDLDEGPSTHGISNTLNNVLEGLFGGTGEGVTTSLQILGEDMYTGVGEAMLKGLTAISDNAPSWVETFTTGVSGITTFLAGPFVTGVSEPFGRLIIYLSAKGAELWTVLSTQIDTFKLAWETSAEELVTNITAKWDQFQLDVAAIWATHVADTDQAKIDISKALAVIEANITLLQNTFNTQLTFVRLWIQQTITKVLSFKDNLLILIDEGLAPVKLALEEAWQAIKDFFSEFTEGVIGRIGRIASAISDMAAALWDLVEAAIAYGKNKIASFGGGGETNTSGDSGTGSDTGPAPSATSTVVLGGGPEPVSAAVTRTARAAYSPPASPLDLATAYTIGTRGRAPQITSEDRMADIRIASGANAALNGGVLVQFGDVTINNDMDMAIFEQRVRNVVSDSITG